MLSIGAQLSPLHFLELSWRTNLVISCIFIMIIVSTRQLNCPNDGSYTVKLAE